MASSKKSLGLLITQIAIAVLLVIMGIMTMQLNQNATGWTGLDNLVGAAKAGVNGNEIASAVYSLLGTKSALAKPIIIILGVCELIGGVFLLVNVCVNTGKLENIFLLVILVMWIIVIVLVDILGKTGITAVNWNSMGSVLSFLKGFATHLLVLGTLLQVMKKD